jgi:hypothetical protein
MLSQLRELSVECVVGSPWGCVVRSDKACMCTQHAVQSAHLQGIHHKLPEGSGLGGWQPVGSKRFQPGCRIHPAITQRQPLAGGAAKLPRQPRPVVPVFQCQPRRGHGMLAWESGVQVHAPAFWVRSHHAHPSMAWHACPCAMHLTSFFQSSQIHPPPSC